MSLVQVSNIPDVLKVAWGKAGRVDLKTTCTGVSYGCFRTPLGCTGSHWLLYLHLLLPPSLSSLLLLSSFVPLLTFSCFFTLFLSTTSIQSPGLLGLEFKEGIPTENLRPKRHRGESDPPTLSWFPGLWWSQALISNSHGLNSRLPPGGAGDLRGRVGKLGLILSILLPPRSAGLNGICSLWPLLLPQALKGVTSHGLLQKMAPSPILPSSATC